LGRLQRCKATIFRAVIWIMASLAPMVQAPAAAAEPAAAPTTVRMVLSKVAEGVYFVQGESAMGSAANQNFISNAGVVITDDGVLVVDALGSPPLAQQLIDEIHKLTAQPIRYVVVTHYHADHIYGLQTFRAAGAKIVAHGKARDYIGSDTARLRLDVSRVELFPWIDEQTQVLAPDIWLGADPQDADLVLKLGQTEVFIHHAGPAHTPEDVIVNVPAKGVLFAGDLMFRGRIPFVGQADSQRWIAALGQMMQMGAKVVVPGHGGASTDPTADLGLTRDYLAYLRQVMGAAARDLEPFEQAYQRADWSRFEKLPLFGAVNRMNAYNTYLLMEREAP
jgi:glyoxylase-like metal-dependent hydrolase (beta-lactamase superfamily II)